MLDHYRAQLTRVPFGLAVAASLVVLFTPESGVPVAPPGTDKVVHLLLFAALAITGRMAGLRRPLLPGLLAYAVLSEVAQGLLPIGRSFDPVDIGFDALGAVAGWTVVAVSRRG
ncbi:VanZ like protein [Saccharopolyspora erythraea NRRL 2338]|uniref:VanZ-like domain-containing protein n=2 Tax=Saccharopolyspora erythraea TaxID=1836 RepID=A4FLI1_SACEN|nr:VanZ family protein [Saccharopolyspora erythraea]EQD85282.1 VanZ family protein [Saccharopolyspora erythraea D]PFG98546.1 VanZ like protein [Saccharopolyspora erythraea NRRL 2338]QRK88588.1 VanZ family protein [Saccharopolyspora erythraea]CAM04906.1 hypothetical protein SACE_5721 [Saccharopolyspora erythraea NRRL 2338]